MLTVSPFMYTHENGNINDKPEVVVFKVGGRQEQIYKWHQRWRIRYGIDKVGGGRSDDFATAGEALGVLR
jgi:hypothetical protein